VITRTRDLAGEADRRAVDSARRLPGGNFRCCGRVNGRYRDSVRQLLRGDGGSSRSWPRASRAAATSTGTAGGVRTPASTSSPPRRLHAADLVSYERKHNGRTGREQDGGEPQPGLELRDRRAERRPRDPLARERQSATSCHLVLAGRPDAPLRGRAQPQPARQQQRVLPGQRAVLARLGARPGEARLPGLRPRLARLRREQPGLRRRCSSRAAAARRASRHLLVQAFRRRDDRRRLEGSSAAAWRGCAGRPDRERTTRASDLGDTLALAV